MCLPMKRGFRIATARDVRLVSAIEIDRGISADVIGKRVDDLLMDQACRAGDVDQ